MQPHPLRPANRRGKNLHPKTSTPASQQKEFWPILFCILRAGWALGSFQNRRNFLLHFSPQAKIFFLRIFKNKYLISKLSKLVYSRRRLKWWSV
jgi:hypothetical protein